MAWFGEEEGTNLCKHVVAMGGFGFSTAWQIKKYERMFDSYWKKHEDKFTTTEEALEQFAEDNDMDFEVVEGSYVCNTRLGVYVIFKRKNSRKKQ